MACELLEHQTHALARAMFVSDLQLGALVPNASEARAQWMRDSLARGDAALARIVSRLDASTFERTWRRLHRALDQRGPEATLRWLTT